MDDPVNITEIATRAGVQPGTVSRWRQRSKDPKWRTEPFPQPRWARGHIALWDWTQDVRPWLIRNGRLRT